ncbi:parathyroid hormone/parathyroid hormone-related peptide receptor-like isoform X2 [Homalodisca vitripennis]|uniref:parathyroid hormone/parathyroid hormone-related peptide receptor-like isoform X2 n=1 Tax=Homalodisca vitripennis TaxID=197043 RepID=UPI001EEBE32F|nr:parathyroid hormone/parathyroid hormone-related peptide receptor-like isoform X2 [Homalodisca vitripennis]
MPPFNMKTNTDLAKAIYREKISEQDRRVREMALECHAAITNTSAPVSLEDCPTIWDGIMCWPSTPSGVLRSLPCPGYILGFSNPQNFASKQCTTEGEWFVRPTTNTTWTNYSQCYSARTTNVIVEFPDIDNASLIAQYVPLAKAVSHVGYGVSLATLIVAFCIFATFKRLRCPRNKLHMHLFVSFMLRAFLTLLKDSLFVRGIGLPSDFTEKDGDSYYVHGNQFSWQCKLIVSLWQYFIMANYSWILMEGLYLHNLIFFSVFSDTSSIALYVVLGWGLPLFFVVPWVFVRALLEDTLCWTTNENSYYFQLIKGPTTASILVNLILFINIVRVLMSKLQASICEETRRFRRWAKSTLVLVPLFGVHYVVFLTISYLGIKGKVELIWLFIDQLFASFQGFFVAILYCLLNGEVRTELAKKWRRLSWGSRAADHRASLPLNSLQPPAKRSYLGTVFSRRRRRFRSHENGYKRGSTACTETCMSTLVSSVTTDLSTTTTFVCQPAMPLIPDNADSGGTSSAENQLLT